MTLLLLTVAALVSYLLGAIPAAAWVARAHGIDIRKVGSGNSGATNVLRSMGPVPGVAVALFDVSKGALAIVLARTLGLSDPQAAVCGVAAVLGHNFSPFLGFRGGKGVATTFGTIVALSPVVGLGMFVLGILTVALTRLVSAGSILGGVTSVFVAVVTGQPLWLTLLVSGLVALMVWQHRENLVRLQAGRERRLGDKDRAA